MPLTNSPDLMALTPHTPERLLGGQRSRGGLCDYADELLAHPWFGIPFARMDHWKSLAHTSGFRARKSG